MPRQAKVPEPRFNLKSHKDENSPVLVVLVYRYQNPETRERIRLVYSTGEKVIPKYWDQGRGKAKVVRNHHEYSEVNDRLSKLEVIVKAIFQEFDLGKISKEDFKLEIDYRTEKKDRPVEPVSNQVIPFMQFVDQFINDRIAKPNARRGTWKMFRTMYNHLQAYSTEKGIVLNYDDFDNQFQSDFENWLFAPPRKHSINYAAKMFSILRQFLHAATREEYNTKMTFTQWQSLTKVKTKKPVLSFEELKTLYELDLSKNKKLERVRDLFLIGAYSGLRFSDFTRIEPQHIIHEDGVSMIEIWTKKTDTQVVIPLIPELQNILERYNYKSPKSISNQKMNDYLKDVFQVAEFNDEVVVKKTKGGRITEEIYQKWQLAQSHMARRSFATNFYELGIPAGDLMLITGHSTEKQFFEYINTDKRKNAKRIARRFALLLANQNIGNV